ncbi:uncharacterized protein LOC132561550 [Ylistrum balloti]|uniref:uncharacterized protein LOC132561550 n=1 Tax=Ylistrum balloti TaxID=509963 RepID=UPI002905CAD2|nr:uncharacterized protein LOC132561550 [Ylistrum balloti]
MHRFMHHVKNILQLFILLDLLLLSRGQFQGQAPGSAGLFRNGAEPLRDGASLPLFNNAGNVGTNRENDEEGDSIAEGSSRNPIPKNNLSGRRKGVCRDGWKLAEMNNVPICIYINHKALSWDDAKDTCRQDFGFLLKAEAPVYVDSKSIGEYLRRQEIMNIWTGLHEEDGTLVWDELAPHKVRPYNDFMESRLKADRTWDWEIDDDTDDSDICGDLDLSRLQLPLEEEILHHRRKRSTMNEKVRIRKRRNPEDNLHPEMAFSQHLTETLTQSPVETMFPNTERSSFRPLRQYGSDGISNNIPTNSENNERTKPFQDLAFLKDIQPKEGTKPPHSEQQQQHNLYGQNSEWQSQSELGEGDGVPNPVLSEIVAKKPIHVTQISKPEIGIEQQQSEGQTLVESGHWNSNVENNPSSSVPTPGLQDSGKNLEDITPPPNEDGDNDPTAPTTIASQIHTIENNEINLDIPTSKPLHQDGGLDFVSSKKDSNIETPELNHQMFVEKETRLQEAVLSSDSENVPQTHDLTDDSIRTLSVTKPSVDSKDELSMPPSPENTDQDINLDLMKDVEMVSSQTTPSIQSSQMKNPSQRESDSDKIEPSFSFIPTVPTSEDVTPLSSDTDIPTTNSNFDDITTRGTVGVTKEATTVITGATQNSIPALGDIKTAPSVRRVPMREPPTTISDDSGEFIDVDTILKGTQARTTTANPSFDFTSPDQFINNLGIIGNTVHKSNKSELSNTSGQNIVTSSEYLKTTEDDSNASDDITVGEKRSDDTSSKDSKDSEDDTNDSDSNSGSDDKDENIKAAFNDTDESYPLNSREMASVLLSNHSDENHDGRDSGSNGIENDSYEEANLANFGKTGNTTEFNYNSNEFDEIKTAPSSTNSSFNKVIKDATEYDKNGGEMLENDDTENGTEVERSDTIDTNGDGGDDVSIENDDSMTSNTTLISSSKENINENTENDDKSDDENENNIGSSSNEIKTNTTSEDDEKDDENLKDHNSDVSNDNLSNENKENTSSDDNDDEGDSSNNKSKENTITDDNDDGKNGSADENAERTTLHDNDDNRENSNKESMEDSTEDANEDDGHSSNNESIENTSGDDSDDDRHSSNNESVENIKIDDDDDGGNSSNNESTENTTGDDNDDDGHSSKNESVENTTGDDNDDDGQSSNNESVENITGDENDDGGNSSNNESTENTTGDDNDDDNDDDGQSSNNESVENITGDDNDDGGNSSNNESTENTTEDDNDDDGHSSNNESTENTTEDDNDDDNDNDGHSSNNESTENTTEDDNDDDNDNDGHSSNNESIENTTGDDNDDDKNSVNNEIIENILDSDNDDDTENSTGDGNDNDRESSDNENMENTTSGEIDDDRHGSDNERIENTSNDDNDDDGDSSNTENVHKTISDDNDNDSHDSDDENVHDTIDDDDDGDSSNNKNVAKRTSDDDDDDRDNAESTENITNDDRESNDDNSSNEEDDDRVTSIPIDLDLMESIQEADESNTESSENIDKTSENNDELFDDDILDENSDMFDETDETVDDSNEIDSVVIPTALVGRNLRKDDIEGSEMTLRTFVVEEGSDDIDDDLRRNFAEKDSGLRIHQHLDSFEEIEEFVPPADKREHIPHSDHQHKQRKPLSMKLSQCRIRKPSVCYSPPIILEDTASSCPPGWYGHIFSKKCYKVIVSRMPFTEARQRCKNEGGILATMGNSNFHAQLVLMSILKSQTKGFVVGPSSLFWVQRLPPTEQCHALTVNGYMEASCNSPAEVVCERDALITVKQDDDDDDEEDDTEDDERSHEPERVYFSSKSDNSKLSCRLTNKNRELPTVWFKDGKIVDIKLERRSPSLVSLLGVMGRPLTPLPEPALTTSNSLELGPMFRKTLEYSSSQKLTNEMFQGNYWCEVWEMNPFNRRRSRSYSVKYSDVITFRGTIEMPNLSHKGILLHNMINQQNAKLSNIMKDINYINAKILPVLQQNIPAIQSVVTYGSKIEETQPLKLGYYTFLKTADNYTMAEENMAYLVLRKELRETKKNTKILLTLPGKTPIHIMRSIDLTSTVACPLDRLKDEETGLVATFPRSSIDTEVNSIEICEGSVAGRASCKGDYDTGAYWTNVAVTKTCNNESHAQPEEAVEEEEEDEEEEGIFESMTLEDRLKELAEMDMEDNNVEGIMQETASIVEKVEEMTAVDVDYIADIMDKTVNVHKITKEVGMNVLKTMDKVMSIDEGEIEKANDVSKASKRILKSFEKVAENIYLEDDGKLRIVKPNVALEVWELNKMKVPIIGLAARQGKDGRLDEVFDEDRIFTVYNTSQLYGDIDAAIELPSELIASEMFDGKGIKDDTRLYMMVYRDGRLFQDNSKGGSKIDVTRDLRLGVLNSYIISASISGKHIKGLTHKVKTVFKPLQSPANDERKCAFWDFDLNNKVGGWSTAGCVYNGQVNGRDVCLCDHLTNFAVLIDFYGQAEPVDRDHEFSLSIISLVGLSLSILGLSLTIISYVFFRKLRQGRAQQTLFNLALAMLCSWVVFLTGIRQTHNFIGCIIVAVLLHYFILSSFMWMLMEAFLQYLTFVKVLGTYVTRYTLKTVIIAWGLPLIPIIVVLSLDPNLYRGGDRYCWMSLEAFYFAFALPVGVIILCNLVVFILTVTSICRRPTGLRSNQSKQKIAITNLQAAITSFVLLGLTWLLGYLAIADARVVFQYAFTILNSLQGFFIFVLFVARKKQVRDQWLIVCCCKDPKMEKALRSLSASASIPSTCSGRSSGSYSGRSDRSDSTRTTSSFVNNDYETIYTVPYSKHSRESLYYRKV